MAVALTLFGQSAVRLDVDGRRIALDPGAFSDPVVLEGADAVLITHAHPDHVVPEDLATALAGTSVPVWAPEDLVPGLVAAGLDAGRVRTAVPGEEFDAAGVAVRALGGRHAEIHPDLPHPQNVAYLLEGRILHPGDSFVTPRPGEDLPEGARLDVLLLPVAAPWMRFADAVAHARAVRARWTLPIHDAILSDAGRGVIDRQMPGLADGTEYRRPTLGEAFTV